MELTTSEKTDSLWGSFTESTSLLRAKSSIKPQLASRGRKLAVMVACLVQQCFSVGVGFGLSVMYPEIVSVFQSPRSEASLVQGLYLGLSVGCGIFMTGVIKKVGPGPTIMLGASVTTAGFFACAFAKNVPTIIALAGVLGGLGMCTCYLSAFISVSWMFHESPGFPLVCLTIGSSVGQFSIPYIYEILISNFAWSGAFVLISGLSLQCLPFGLIIYTSRRYFVTDDDEQPKYRTVCEGYVDLLKDRLLWIILFDFLLIALAGNVEAWFIVDIMVSRGYTREAGSVLVTALGFANFIGRISGSTVRLKCTNTPTVYHWLWICPIIAVGHALVINLRDYWAIFAACLLQGSTFGMNNSQTPAIMYEVSGLGKYPQAMSLVNVMYGCGNLFSNLLGGFIRDSFGQYDLVFNIAIAAAILVTCNSAVASIIIHRRKKRAQTSYETLK